MLCAKKRTLVRICLGVILFRVMHMASKFRLFVLSSAVLVCTASAQQSSPAASNPSRPPTTLEITAESATGAAAEVVALDKKIGQAIVAGDVAFFSSVTADDFSMTHGGQWTNGGKPTAIDTKQSFLKRVQNKSYTVYDLGPIKIEMHSNLAIIYGRYIANIPEGRAADKTWFSCWFEHIYEKQNGKWKYVSHRTVYGPTYGPTRESVQDK